LNLGDKGRPTATEGKKMPTENIQIFRSTEDKVRVHPPAKEVPRNTSITLRFHNHVKDSAVLVVLNHELNPNPARLEIDSRRSKDSIITPQQNGPFKYQVYLGRSEGGEKAIAYCDPVIIVYEPGPID
jgi:hypothetical protein